MNGLDKGDKLIIAYAICLGVFGLVTAWIALFDMRDSLRSVEADTFACRRLFGRIVQAYEKGGSCEPPPRSAD